MSIVDKTPSGQPMAGDSTSLTSLGTELAALRQVSKGTVRIGTFWHPVGQSPVPVAYIGVEYYILPMVMFYVLMIAITVIRFRTMIAKRAIDAIVP